jgi:hypothetical protein
MGAVQPIEIFIKRAPIQLHAVFPCVIREVSNQPIIQGCNRCSFAGNFRSHALSYLARGTIVDEQIELRLALNVDEARGNGQA